MYWGIPTLIENSSIEESINLCKELNFDFVELNMNLPQYQLENIDVEKLNRLKVENNIFYTIHLDENLNVNDFNSYVANAYLKTILDTIEIAKSLMLKLSICIYQRVFTLLCLIKKYIYLNNTKKIT